MKRLVILSTLLVLILSACGAEATPTPAPLPTESNLPVIPVDAEHMLKSDMAYDIPAGPGFVLDASTYIFGTATGPTLVRVVMDGREYQGNWTNPENIQTVLAESLLPPPGMQPLTGFPAGKQLIVAIGALNDRGEFDASWVGVVNVH
jgi:hypothetical protein